MTRKATELGLGLVGIGRPWGAIDAVVPAESQAMRLLERAVELGITFFDTAPAYGLSEERLGRFLARLRPQERKRLTIATKFGEHWNAADASTYVDHSSGALIRSLEQSMERLHGGVDILQVHKASVGVLASDGVASALMHARSLGVKVFGASASDLPTIEVALGRSDLSYVQLPLNAGNLTFEQMARAAGGFGKSIIVNRPFNMGHMMEAVGEDESQRLHPRRVAAYRVICERLTGGVVLTGTKRVVHLEENVRAFEEAARDSSVARRA